jgi:N6-L-threonylcarbamoyladenine synthase
MKNPKILAIETSCDETAAAILFGSKIRSNVIYSQLALYQKTKGIVPEVASRAHIEKIISVIKQALSDAKVRPSQIDLIAVTVGPGLIGSLLVGVDTARSLAYLLNRPIIPINHIEAHLYAVFVKKIQSRKIFPAIAMVVSGGHTSILLMRGHGNYKLLGMTIDDAAGEAFDKVAKILNLSYPGGPSISLEAKRAKRKGKKIYFPRPMINSSDFNFSFSGLKTAVLYKVRELGLKKTKKLKPELAYQFQKALVEVLVEKVTKAARKYKAKTIILGGGVVANELLRFEMRKKVKNLKPKINLLIPDLNLCTDNAVIVGICGYYKYKTFKNCLSNWQKIKVNLNPDL